MADETAELKDTPEGFKNPFREVTLSDGSIIRVWTWGWLKFRALIPLVGLLGNSDRIAIDSVAPADRERIAQLSGSEMLAVAVAATELNLPAETLKNLGTLLQQQARVEETGNQKRAQ